jgi:hypothetical protein
MRELFPSPPPYHIASGMPSYHQHRPAPPPPYEIVTSPDYQYRNDMVDDISYLDYLDISPSERNRRIREIQSRNRHIPPSYETNEQPPSYWEEKKEEKEGKEDEQKGGALDSDERLRPASRQPIEEGLDTVFNNVDEIITLFRNGNFDIDNINNAMQQIFNAFTTITQNNYTNRNDLINLGNNLSVGVNMINTFLPPNQQANNILTHITNTFNTMMNMINNII